MPEAKRVLVLYADAGFGHRSAALAVEAALKDKYGDRCEVELVNPLEDRRAPLILRDSQADYDKMVTNMPELYKLGYQASDGLVSTPIFESALTVMLIEVMRDVIRRSEPDAVVSTYPLYQAPLEAYLTLSRRYIPVFTVVTDLVTVHRLWLNDSVDRCLVPTPQVRELALEAGLRAWAIGRTHRHPHDAENAEAARDAASVLTEALGEGEVEAALLERETARESRFRFLRVRELEPALEPYQNPR
jgi:1,2-diacylglycerol 3-beta-galactosyltransferase